MDESVMEMMDESAMEMMDKRALQMMDESMIDMLRDEDFRQTIARTKKLEELKGLDPHAKADSTNLPVLYRAAMEGSWKDASPIFSENANAKTTKISTLGMTALHVAASCGRSDFVEELVMILSKEQLEARDQLGRTALHHVALAADVDAAKAMVKKNPNLPYLGDVNKHTPFFYAAKWRHPSESKKMVKYLYQVTQEENLPNDLEAGDACNAFTDDSAADLIVAITASGSYDIALRIIRRYPELALGRNEKKMSVLHVLAMQPKAFRSGNNLSAWISWMYEWVQVDTEETKDEDSKSGIARSKNRGSAAPFFKFMSKFSKGIREIFKTKQRHLRAVRLAEFVCKELQKKGMEFVENYFIPKDNTAILHLAMEHGVFELLQECLKHFPDLIWYADTATPRLPLHDSQCTYTATGLLSLHDAQSTDQAARRFSSQDAKSTDTATGHLSLHDAQSTDAATRHRSLHDAQSTATRHFSLHDAQPTDATTRDLSWQDAQSTDAVPRLLSLHDTQYQYKATGHLSLCDTQHAETGGGRLMLHVAIEHRRVKIFNYIINFIGKNTKAYAESQLQGKNNTLHLAAKLAPTPQLQSLPGPAFQMQRELQWFKAVEALVYQELRIEKNSDEKTPQEVFTDAHKELLSNAKEWIKDTSNSCMVVATLVATVAFAAMITVPGGNNTDTGTPVLARKKLFVAFSVSNALSMISSAISLLMFLSMQTSKCTEEDFLESLPKILLRGLLFLGIAVATMMISFGTAIGLLLQTRLTWAYIPITVAACFPVIIFTRLQLPLLLRTFIFKSGPVISQRQRGRKFWRLRKIGYTLLANDRV